MSTKFSVLHSFDFFLNRSLNLHFSELSLCYIIFFISELKLTALEFLFLSSLKNYEDNQSEIKRINITVKDSS